MSDVEPMRRPHVQPQTNTTNDRRGRRVKRRVARLRVPPGITTRRVESDQGPVEIRVSKAHEWMLKAWTWRVNNRGYVVRRTSYRDPHVPHPRGRTILLHRFILGLDDGSATPRTDLVVDHVNGDTLDNVVDNLQVVTQGENVKRGYASRNGGHDI